MTEPLSLPAPAKLNLFLHITGRRADGYHLLQTLFVLLDHGDRLDFRPASQLRVTCPDLPGAMEDNLVWRAARCLQQHTGCRAGAHVHVHKRLPAGGGLGGGSSDAATALLGLNHLWRLQLPLKTLAELGLTLGADVPVFVHGHAAFAEGVGERLTPVALPPQWYVVVFPGVSVATAKIFGDPELTRSTPESTLAAFLGDPSGRSFGNDCEAVVRRHFPAVDTALEWLREQCGESRMSGTGACIFAPVTHREQGQDIVARLPSHWKGFVARSCTRSPLHQALADLH